MRYVTGGTGPHFGQPIAVSVAPDGSAAGALILVHGRGGSAADMLGLAGSFSGLGFTCLAPEAVGGTWYPHAFNEPVARNEPYLGSALSVLGDLVDRLVLGGMEPGHVTLLGFSQGACLALEFAWRRSERLGAVIGLSGGLIGDNVVQPALGTRAFQAMPVVLGCSGHDPHIPVARVHETDAAFREAGADVTLRIYPGASHGVNDDEMKITYKVLAEVAGASGPHVQAAG